ncbi:acyltransferase family protein [Thalassobacterium sedimentorum]|uniref:acyltransferase family protein n=1 Tax=Thalassobacterium sedimentorum TaxID=3041258 RepID=UPI003CE53035
MKQTIKPTRLIHIDVVKSISITLVVFGHVYRNADELSLFLQSFRMPLFFLVSGYFVNHDRYNSFKKVVSRRLNTLILPYLFFYLLTYAYWLLIESNFRGQAGGASYDWWLPAVGIIYGSSSYGFMGHNSPLWFIPCLLSVQIIDCYISRINNFYFQILAVILLTASGFYLLPMLHFRLPFGLNTASVVLVFYFSGKYIRRIHSLGIATKASIVVGVLIFYYYAILGNFSTYDLFTPRFDNKSDYLLQAFSASVLIVLICEMCVSLLPKATIKPLSFFGINSLIILCLHDPIKRVVIFIYSKASGISIADIRDDLIHSTSCLILTFLILLPAIYFYNRFLRDLLKIDRAHDMATRKPLTTTSSTTSGGC